MEPSQVSIQDFQVFGSYITSWPRAGACLVSWQWELEARVRKPQLFKRHPTESSHFSPRAALFWGLFITQEVDYVWFEAQKELLQLLLWPRVKEGPDLCGVCNETKKSQPNLCRECYENLVMYPLTPLGPPTSTRASCVTAEIYIVELCRRERGGDKERRSCGSRIKGALTRSIPPSCWRSPPVRGGTMRSILLKMLAAMLCTLTACTDIVPMQNFDLEKVGQMFVSLFSPKGLTYCRGSDFFLPHTLKASCLWFFLTDCRQVVHVWNWQ